MNDHEKLHTTFLDAEEALRRAAMAFAASVDPNDPEVLGEESLEDKLYKAAMKYARAEHALTTLECKIAENGGGGLMGERLRELMNREGGNE